MPSTVCSVGSGHSYDDLKAEYAKVKKSMPGLTPAAWRKAAAQSLGIDYKVFLQIWKTKGKTKMVPQSTPTLPAASTTVPTSAGAPTAQGIGKIIDGLGIKKSKLHKGKTASGDAMTKGYTLQKSPLDDSYHVSIHGGYGGSSVAEMNKIRADIISALKSQGYEVKPGITNMKLKVSKKVSTAPKKATPKKPVASDDAVKFADDEIELVMGEFNSYKSFTAHEAIKDLDDVLDEALGKAADLFEKSQIKAKINAAKKKLTGTPAKIPKPTQVVPSKQPGYIQTPHGPLSHDLAQSVYKKMKKDMPGATPAVWRKAAAEYLEVDYKDYLVAWKKPKPGGVPKAPSPAQLPDKPDAPTPLKPSDAGKYANKEVTVDELKDELAKLYGPGANKDFIAITYDPHTGIYNTFFPNSLLKSAGAQDKVADQLKAMGLKTTKKPDGSYSIWSIDKYGKVFKAPPKSAPGVVPKENVTTTLPDGRVVLDMAEEQKRSDAWYNNLTPQQSRAWEEYTADGYIDINRVLRGKIPLKSSAIRQWTEDLTKTMEKTTSKFLTFRGTKISLDQFKKGAKWTDDGFMSTAVDPGRAWSGVKFEIEVTPGTRGRYIGQNSSSGNEAEFLIDKGTNFRVLSVDRVSKTVKLVTVP